MNKRITPQTPPPRGITAEAWCDGSCPANPGPMGVGIYIQYPGLHAIEQGFTLPDGTNNQAEYHALILTLRRLLRDGTTHATVHMDSLLVVNQVNGKWKVKKGRLKNLWAESQSLCRMFVEIKLIHDRRELNEAADYLSKHPTGDDPLPPAESEMAVIRFKQFNPQPRKLLRRQAAMVKWWWVTGRCTNEYLLSRLYGLSHALCGRIGKDETYRDITTEDLPKGKKNVGRG